MNPYSLLTIKPNFIPQQTISTLLSHKSSDYSRALVGYDDSQSQSDHRQTKWLTLPPNIHSQLYQTIHDIHENHLKPIYDSTIKHVEPPQFLRYDINEHYDCHNDSESWVDGKLQRVVDRDISVLLYLNDDYTGGEIEFTQLGLTLKPKAGMLLAFPSYLEFEHKVHPVTKGTRYTIVSWIATEKRIYARPYDTPTNIPRTWILPAQELHSQVLQ
jgi:predicted 2-oxoglutarate/Fe(II)-dependent dioxygenase YbiX